MYYQEVKMYCEKCGAIMKPMSGVWDSMMQTPPRMTSEYVTMRICPNCKELQNYCPKHTWYPAEQPRPSGTPQCPHCRRELELLERIEPLTA